MKDVGRCEKAEWARRQLQEYNARKDAYELYAEVLGQILKEASRRYAPLSMVHTRAKTIAGFGEKMFRKRSKYVDSVNRITDLCGGRVVVPTLEEVKLLSQFIEKHFEIDWPNSVDVSKRLGPSEFGYRAVHYIVQFKKGVFPTKEIDVSIDRSLFGLKAEIQVKTILEHGWGVFTHDRAYKGSFKMPEKWEREMAAQAALLEEADRCFARTQVALARYAASYGAYLTEEQIVEEIENAEIILEFDPGNLGLVARIGKLAMSLGDFGKAADILGRHAESGYQPIVRDLGVALCKLHSPGDDEYRRGQRYLETAAAPPNRDPDALASLAGTWKGIDDDKAMEYYRQAYELDPSDAYPLGNYLDYQIIRDPDTSVLAFAGPVIDGVVQRSREQIEVGMNLPWAFFELGKLRLLTGATDESLWLYAKAIQLSSAEFMIGTTLRSLERLEAVKEKIRGYDLARTLLLLGLASKFPKTDTIKRMNQRASPQLEKPIKEPVVVVAGTCDTDGDERIDGYRNLLMEAFEGFKGTIISGGTTAGISGLAGEIGHRHREFIRTIGYVPEKLPADCRTDNRYSQHIRVPGLDSGMAPLLQYWVDIVAAGIKPSKVKLLGVGGGAITAAEYRVALSVGAQVAILERSGREAERLLADQDWWSSRNLFPIPPDVTTLRAYVKEAAPKLASDIRETVAKAIHEEYRRARASAPSQVDPAMNEFSRLPEDLKESNRQQADDILEKLGLIGCTVYRVANRSVAQGTFTPDEVERMAEMEHGRFTLERLREGWRRGETKDVTKKISPHLVPWDSLADEVKECDRQTVRKIPEFLGRVGLEVRRSSDYDSQTDSSASRNH